MGKVRANNALTVVQGKVGELSFVHYRDGRIVVRKSPERSAEFTPAQIEAQQRFARAALFLRAAKANAAVYAIYKNAALIRRKRACDLAMADFLSPPVIRELDLTSYTGAAGEVIRIDAFDTFAVKEVGLVIRKGDGTVLEEGQAMLNEESSLWCYVSQQTARRPQTLTIEASASDAAGNVTAKTHHHVLEP